MTGRTGGEQQELSYWYRRQPLQRIELEHLLMQSGVHPTRYADDIIVPCDSKERAEETLRAMKQWMEEQGLKLHPNKTKILDMSQPKAELNFLIRLIK